MSSLSDRPLGDLLAVSRRVVACYGAAPGQISRFLLKGKRRYLGDTIARFDRQLGHALPPQVAACLAGGRRQTAELVVGEVGAVAGASAAEVVVRLYQAGMAEVRRRARGQGSAADPPPAELIAAAGVVAPVLDAWCAASARWASLADQEFKQAMADELGRWVPRPKGLGRKVTPAKRALSAYLARFAEQRVGVQTLARVVPADAKLQTLLREAGCDPVDEPAVRRTLEAALRWARKHLGDGGIEPPADSGATALASPPATHA